MNDRMTLEPGPTTTVSGYGRRFLLFTQDSPRLVAIHETAL
jgi:hypothetical protein